VLQRPLARELADGLRAGAPMAPDTPVQWAATLSVVGLDTVGHGRDMPFALRLRAVMRLQRTGTAGAQATEHTFDALSRETLVTADWRADGGAALQRALDDAVQSLAAQMLTAMRLARAGR
jgi:hypothetical protein